MTRTVQCVLLQREAPGLETLPYPGELGQRIFENVSREAWQQWMGRQTLLINEYRINPLDPKSRKFIEDEMLSFFFGGNSSPPPDFVSPDA